MYKLVSESVSDSCSASFKNVNEIYIFKKRASVSISWNSVLIKNMGNVGFH